MNNKRNHKYTLKFKHTADRETVLNWYSSKAKAARAMRDYAKYWKSMEKTGMGQVRRDKSGDRIEFYGMTYAMAVYYELNRNYTWDE